MRYKYQALDGQSQEISGILNAETERDAIRQLQKRGLTTLNLTALAKEKSVEHKASHLKQRDVLIVLHELATLLESGVTLIEAIDSLATSSHHPTITQTFSTIASQLRQGQAFSHALRQSPLKLPWYILQLVEAGELTGKVATALRDGVNQMEYEAQVSSEMRNAMIYPIILIISGVSAVLLIFTIVVPRFSSMLQNRGGDIPWLAQAVLNTGMFLNTHFGLIITVGIAVATTVIYLFRQPKLRAKAIDMTINFPLLGVWLLESETARWAAMMGTLLENRVSLLKALELSNQGIRVPSLNAKLIQVSKSVRAGAHLSQALQDNDALTSTGHNLIRAGEKAGELPRMLRSLAKLLEESGRVRMKRFLLLIEPIAILVIGGVIGLIITGVILAITSINQIKF